METTEIVKNKQYAVFFDYKNILDGFKGNGEELKEDGIYPLLKLILEQGEIIFGFVFVPEHLVRDARVSLLSYKYRFSVIACPREYEGVIAKDKDSVDTMMDSLAKRFLEHSDITDVAIFSGDGDFAELVTYAFWRKKRVTVLGVRNSVNGRFMEMAQEGVIGLVQY